MTGVMVQEHLRQADINLDRAGVLVKQSQITRLADCQGVATCNLLVHRYYRQDCLAYKPHPPDRCCMCMRMALQPASVHDFRSMRYLL